MPHAPARPGRSRRAVLARLAALLLAPLAGACQELGPDQSRLVLRYREVAPLARERFVATLDDPFRQFYLEGIDLVERDGWLVSRELRAAARGELVVRLALRGAATAPAASADLTIPLEPGARWRIDVFPSSDAPDVACGGCAGLRRTAILPTDRPSAQDWLYVTWTADAADASE